MYKLVSVSAMGRSCEVSPRASSYQLSAKKTSLTLLHRLELPTPDGSILKVNSSISFPKPPRISPHVITAEAAIVPFCKELGLYRFDQLSRAKKEIDLAPESPETASKLVALETKESRITQAIINTGFGWLVGMVAPDLAPPEITDITLYYLALFDHDDDADRAMSGGMSVIESETVSTAMLAAFQGKISEIPENYKEHKRVRALLKLHESYFKKFQENDNEDIKEEFAYSVQTLLDYLNSVQSERRHEDATDPIGIESYRSLRGHTGGIQHAISVICLAYGVNFKKLRDTHIEFQYMIESTAKAVGILNDYYSAQTELQELYRRIKKEGDDASDIAVVKSRIQSNLLLIHWRDGLSLEAAAKETLQEYTVQMNSFYTYKNSIFDKIKKNTELRKATYACEGWLFGHGPWGALSGRYNKKHGFIDGPDAVFQKISNLTLPQEATSPACI